MASRFSGGPGTPNDWQLNKSVLETNKHMFENQLYCDVTFVFKANGKPTEIMVSAHRYMLVSRSPVFCAMFEGPAGDNSGRVEIEDVEKAAFVNMLRYIYCEEARLSGDNVLSIFYCAKKYMINGLKTLCAQFLERELSHDNVCFILEQTSLFEERELKERCLELIDDQAQKTVQSAGFREISRGTLESIVRRDSLGLTELDVYKACVRWAEAECRRQHLEVTDHNKRVALGDVVFLIRFPTMDPDQFIKEVSSMEVLTTAEAFNLILLMKGTTPKIPLNFPTNERSGVWNEAFFLSVNIGQFAAYEQFAGYSSTSGPRAQNQVVVPIQVTYCKGNHVLIKSVFIINAHNASLSTVSFTPNPHVSMMSPGTTLNTCIGKVGKFGNRTYLGNQLYEIVFDTPVSLTSGATVSLVFQHSDIYSNATHLQGQSFIGDPKKARTQHQATGLFFGAPNQSSFGQNTCPEKFPEDVCIVIQGSTWQYVVGFKYNVV